MKKTLRLIIPVAAALTAFVVNSYGTPAYAKKEGQKCTVCHSSAAKKGQPNLNDVGKYYHEKKTLEGAPKKG